MAGLVLGWLAAGCAGLPGPGGGGAEKLEAIPPLPGGWELLPSEATAFRKARITTASGDWVVNFDEGVTKIETTPYVVTRIDPKWYPAEGGADAALCRGYQRGNQIMVRMEGSSEFKTEESRIIFEDGKLKEIVKYSLPGAGMGPGAPGEWVPYDRRVMRVSF